jgi:hypothetical protein
MDLVNRERRDPTVPQQIETVWHHQTFGSDVEEIEHIPGDALDLVSFGGRKPEFSAAPRTPACHKASKRGPSSARSTAR